MRRFILGCGAVFMAAGCAEGGQADCNVACPDLAGFEAGCNASGYCEYRGADATEAWAADHVWIFVPPGTFAMGAPETDAYDYAFLARPVHDVTFARGYFVAKFEVSARLYDACVADGACAAGDYDGDSSGQGAQAQSVLDWHDASDVCGWLGARLPTEAEWEYAANGPGDHRKYPWGDAPEPACERGNAVMRSVPEPIYGSPPNYPSIAAAGYGCGLGTPGEVGAAAAGASPIGAMDMAGNVLEWVADASHDDYVGAPSDGSAWLTPPSDDDARVIRGGGWYQEADGMFVSRRYGNPSTVSDSYTGARCALSLPR